MNNLKFSQYNSILKITSQSSVIYNSKKDKCVIIPNDMNDILNFNIDEIKSHNPKLYSDLKEIGAIVNENKNELQDVINLSKEIDNSDNHFRLIINPTMSCNFSCWYCYESHIIGSKINENNLIKIYKLIDNIILNNKNLTSFDLSFFGGEPLMYYSKTTLHIIDYYRSKYRNANINFTISFTSNGYLLSDKILKHLIHGNEYKHFQITLDGNEQEHNKIRVSKKENGSYKKILNSISLLLENKIDVLVRINYTSKNLYSLNDIINDFKNLSVESKNHLRISFHRVWQDNDNNMSVAKSIKKIKESYKKQNLSITDNESVLDNLKNPCYADKKNELVVNFNGDIYKCTARDFNQENKYGTLNEKGEVDWIQEKLTEWENIKIQSKACQSCRILPLCGGGCHQVNLETKGMDACQMGFSEKDKDEVILKRLSELFVSEEI